MNNKIKKGASLIDNQFPQKAIEELGEDIEGLLSQTSTLQNAIGFVQEYIIAAKFAMIKAEYSDSVIKRDFYLNAVRKNLYWARKKRFFWENIISMRGIGRYIHRTLSKYNEE